jgi:hypothetical protein
MDPCRKRVFEFEQREQVDRRFGSIKKGPVFKQGGLEMKKFVLAMALFVVMMGAQVVQAAWYTCSVNSTGPAAVYLTDTAATPAFANRAFSLPTAAATRNQMLAMILTALAAGKNLYVSLASPAQWTMVGGLQVLN